MKSPCLLVPICDTYCSRFRNNDRFMMGDAAEARFEADLAKAIALSLQTEAKDTERRRISGSAQINLPPGKSCYIEHSE